MSGTVVAGQKLTSELLGMPAWTAMSLINSWSNTGGGKVDAQYRWWPLINELEVIGVVTHASISGNSQFCSTFASYLPASTLIDLAHEAVLSGQPTVEVSYDPTGVLQFIALPSGSTRVAFHCWLSLDA